MVALHLLFITQSSWWLRVWIFFVGSVLIWRQFSGIICGHIWKVWNITIFEVRSYLEQNEVFGNYYFLWHSMEIEFRIWIKSEPTKISVLFVSLSRVWSVHLCGDKSVHQLNGATLEQSAIITMNKDGVDQWSPRDKHIETINMFINTCLYCFRYSLQIYRKTKLLMPDKGLRINSETSL